MTEKEYNERPAIRRSDLWKMEESPEKFLFNLEAPEEKTAAMAFGSACHKMVLEKESFFDEYAVMPEGMDRRTKAGKDAFAAFMAEVGEKELVAYNDFVKMAEMRDRLEMHPIAREYLLGGKRAKVEEAFFWKDRDTGEKCKIKCDRVFYAPTIRRYVIVDYKTAKSARTERFNAEVFRLGYYMQAAMYTEGMQIARKLKKRPLFVFVVQEKEAPYSVNVVRVTDEVMRAGEDKFHELLERLHTCREMDYWPGYCENCENETSLPGWLSMEEEE